MGGVTSVYIRPTSANNEASEVVEVQWRLSGEDTQRLEANQRRPTDDCAPCSSPGNDESATSSAIVDLETSETASDESLTETHLGLELTPTQRGSRENTPISTINDAASIQSAVALHCHGVNKTETEESQEEEEDESASCRESENADSASAPAEFSTRNCRELGSRENTPISTINDAVSVQSAVALHCHGVNRTETEESQEEEEDESASCRESENTDSASAPAEFSPRNCRELGSRENTPISTINDAVSVQSAVALHCHGVNRTETEESQEEEEDESASCRESENADSASAPADFSPQNRRELEAFREKLRDLRLTRQQTIARKSQEMRDLRQQLRKEQQQRETLQKSVKFLMGDEKSEKFLLDDEKSLELGEASGSGQEGELERLRARNEELEERLQTAQRANDDLGGKLLQRENDVRERQRLLERSARDGAWEVAEAARLRAKVAALEAEAAATWREYDREKEEINRRTAALKEVVRVSREMLSAREQQVNELKVKLKDIEDSLADKFNEAKLRAEYEKQLSNIKELKDLYEERNQILESERDCHQEKIQQLEEVVSDLSIKYDIAADEVDTERQRVQQLTAELETTTLQARCSQRELTMVNSLLTQMLISPGPRVLDRLTEQLQRNHGLIAQMAACEQCYDAPHLPKLLLDLCAQVEEKDTDWPTSQDSLADSTDDASTISEPSEGLPIVSYKNAKVFQQALANHASALTQSTNQASASNALANHASALTPFANQMSALLESTNQASALLERTNQTSALLESTNQASALLESTNQASALIESTYQTSALLKSTNQTSELLESTNQTSAANDLANQLAAVVDSTHHAVIAEQNSTNQERENANMANRATSLVEADPAVREIVTNLPKVWRVLSELLSHHTAESPPGDTRTCYKKVDTPDGPRTVISVSDTFIHLKELILEKKTLTRELGRLRHLNLHLETRLDDQEKRLSTVQCELHKTWGVVGRMRAQHQQLHNQEKILRYELQEKRIMVNELKSELDECRDLWERARRKNDLSETECTKLRSEFAARRAQWAPPPTQESAESGFSDCDADRSSTPSPTPGGSASCSGLRQRGEDFDEAGVLDVQKVGVCGSGGKADGLEDKSVVGGGSALHQRVEGSNLCEERTVDSPLNEGEQQSALVPMVEDFDETGSSVLDAQKIGVLKSGEKADGLEEKSVVGGGSGLHQKVEGSNLCEETVDLSLSERAHSSVLCEAGQVEMLEPFVEVVSSQPPTLQSFTANLPELSALQSAVQPARNPPSLRNIVEEMLFLHLRDSENIQNVADVSESVFESSLEDATVAFDELMMMSCPDSEDIFAPNRTNTAQMGISNNPTSFFDAILSKDDSIHVLGNPTYSGIPSTNGQLQEAGISAAESCANSGLTGDLCCALEPNHTREDAKVVSLNPNSEVSASSDDRERAREARSQRLSRLEEQCLLLVRKVDITSHKSKYLSNRLEELHDHYSASPSLPGDPQILASGDKSSQVTSSQHSDTVVSLLAPDNANPTAQNCEKAENAEMFHNEPNVAKTPKSLAFLASETLTSLKTGICSEEGRTENEACESQEVAEPSFATLDERMAQRGERLRRLGDQCSSLHDRVNSAVERKRVENLCQNEMPVANRSAVERKRVENLCQNEMPVANRSAVERNPIENLCQNETPVANEPLETSNMDSVKELQQSCDEKHPASCSASNSLRLTDVSPADDAVLSPKECNDQCGISQRPSQSVTEDILEDLSPLNEETAIGFDVESPLSVVLGDLQTENSNRLLDLCASQSKSAAENVINTEESIKMATASEKPQNLQQPNASESAYEPLLDSASSAEFTQVMMANPTQSNISNQSSAINANPFETPVNSDAASSAESASSCPSNSDSLTSYDRRKKACLNKLEAESSSLQDSIRKTLAKAEEISQKWTNLNGTSVQECDKEPAANQNGGACADGRSIDALEERTRRKAERLKRLQDECGSLHGKVNDALQRGNGMSANLCELLEEAPENETTEERSDALNLVKSSSESVKSEGSTQDMAQNLLKAGEQPTKSVGSEECNQDLAQTSSKADEPPTHCVEEDTTCATLDERMARREERLRRLEALCGDLHGKVRNTVSRGNELSSRLTELHEVEVRREESHGNDLSSRLGQVPSVVQVRSESEVPSEARLRSESEVPSEARLRSESEVPSEARLRSESEVPSMGQVRSEGSLDLSSRFREPNDKGASVSLAGVSSETHRITADVPSETDRTSDVSDCSTEAHESDGTADIERMTGSRAQPVAAAQTMERDTSIATMDERMARREERLRRLEALCGDLHGKVRSTVSRGNELSSRLTELHEAELLREGSQRLLPERNAGSQSSSAEMSGAVVDGESSGLVGALARQTDTEVVESANPEEKEEEMG